jgi:hypothetical protein
MPTSDKKKAAKEGFFKRAKITIYGVAPWMAVSFFVFFGNLLLVDYISLRWLTFFWACACICIAVDAAVIAVDLKVSEKRTEDLANQLAAQKSISSQMLRKLDENHTLIMEVRMMLANNNHAPFQYASYQGFSPQKIDHRHQRHPRSASFPDVYAALAP